MNSMSQYVNDHLSSGLLSFRQCKVRDKKKATEVNFHRRRVFGSFV